MKRSIIFVWLALALPAAVAAAAGSPQRLVFVVRHAEAGATDGGADPELTAAGRERAAALADLLGHAGVTRLYSTEFRRARETLAPLAERLGLEVTVVPGSATDEQIRRLAELPPGSIAVVAGHSNTVPALVRGLGGAVTGTHDGEWGEMIDSDSYDRLFVVALGPSGASFELRYGP